MTDNDKLAEEHREVRDYCIRHPDDAHALYRWAKIQILIGDYDCARITLGCALTAGGLASETVKEIKKLRGQLMARHTDGV